MCMYRMVYAQTGLCTRMFCMRCMYAAGSDACAMGENPVRRVTIQYLDRFGYVQVMGSTISKDNDATDNNNNTTLCLSH